MNIELIAGRALDTNLIKPWIALQESNPTLAAPYFSPEFTRIIAEIRDDVEIAVIKQGSEIVAFFPFQRSAPSIAVPLGGTLSDFHGIICQPGFNCEPTHILRACSLVAWDFDHLIASQTLFAGYHRDLEPSPRIDLSNGYDAYAAELRAAGSGQIKKYANLLRRIERDIGPIRFIDHTTDSAILNRILGWKSKQYRESGKSDLFNIGWIRAVIERIHATQTALFAGKLSVLYAGNKLVAGHLGMRSSTVWHYWFPSYDSTYAKYSPGLLLLLKMAENAPSLGLRVIDLGKGLSPYKKRLMNDSVVVTWGSVERRSLLWLRREAKRKMKAAIKAIPLAVPLRHFVRFMRKYT